MSTTFSLFERWKASKGHTSDAAAAKALGVTRAAVSLWRQGRNGKASVLEKMARDLGEDPAQYYLGAMAEAENDAADKRALIRMARRLGAACFALLALAPLMLHSSPVEAAGREMAARVSPHLIHYAKWLTARLRRLGAWCRAFAKDSPCNLPVSNPAPA